MKKFSLLLGALGGAVAGYLFSNKKLRDDLSAAKDPEAAAKLLGKHLQQDGKKLAKQMQDFVSSDDVQKNLSKAKDFAKEKMDQAKTELQKFVQYAEDTATKGAKSAKQTAKKGMRNAAKKVRTEMKKLG